MKFGRVGGIYLIEIIGIAHIKNFSLEDSCQKRLCAEKSPTQISLHPGLTSRGNSFLCKSLLRFFSGLVQAGCWEHEICKNMCAEIKGYTLDSMD